MSILWSVFFGIIQGAAEFLPISSSGHLSILQNVFDINDMTASNLTFDILLHLGTLAAVFIVYRKDIFELIPAFFTMLGKVFGRKFKIAYYSETERFVIMILLATLPMAAVVFFKDYVEIISSYTKVIGALLILNGFILLISDSVSSGKTDITEAKPYNAVIVGFFQLFAVLPGISRSGMTITGGLLRGFTRESAVKFSFILSVPAILGANIFSLPHIFETAIPTSDLVAYAFGMVSAAITGIISMKLLQYISKHASFRFFSVYCFAVGTLSIVFG